VLQDTAQAISSDGAYVPLVSGEWAEVRAAAIGEVETHTSAQGKAQVSAIGEAVRASGRRLPSRWLDWVLHRLKHEGPDRVLTHLSRLSERCQDQELDKKLRHLATRRDLMQYKAHAPAKVTTRSVA